MACHERSMEALRMYVIYMINPAPARDRHMPLRQVCESSCKGAAMNAQEEHIKHILGAPPSGLFSYPVAVAQPTSHECLNIDIESAQLRFP